MLPAMIDIAIVVLLLGTLSYAYMLNKRVRTLMTTLKEMEPMVGAFSSAVDKSSRSVEELRGLSAAAGRVKPMSAEVPKDESERERLPAGSPQAVAQRRAARLQAQQAKRGQTEVPGKSDLVRTFFDLSKERQQ